MNSLILHTAMRYLLPILVLFSVFLLVRGHDEPGGGFVGGLMASAALAMYGLVHSAPAARVALRVDPHSLIGLGLLLAAGSGMWSLVTDGQPFLTSTWESIVVPGVGEVVLGTTLLFDVGVYLVVMGVTLMILLSLEEEE